MTASDAFLFVLFGGGGLGRHNPINDLNAISFFYLVQKVSLPNDKQYILRIEGFKIQL